MKNILEGYLEVGNVAVSGASVSAGSCSHAESSSKGENAGRSHPEVQLLFREF